MTLGKNEKVVVLYLSFSFMLTSTLIYEPIRSMLSIKFIQVLIFTTPLAMTLTWLSRKSMNGKSISIPSMDNSCSKLDVLLALSLFLLTLAILTIRITRSLSNISPDEILHLNITENLYRTLIESNNVYSAYLRNYPILPYLLTITIIPYSEFSLFSVRIVHSIISSFVPIILYFMVREYGVDRKISALTAVALPLSLLYQSQTYLYIFDGFSTLLFTTSFFLLIKGIKTTNSNFFMLSTIIFCLLLITKDPPAAWLLAIYVITITFLMKHKHWPMRRFSSIIIIALPFTAFLFSLFHNHFITLINLICNGWNELTISCAMGTLWDLIFILGWSPYVIVAIIAYRFLRSKEKDVITLISLLAILLAFLTLVPYLPVTRRIIQAIPVFFATTVAYSYKHYSGRITALVLLNLSWWGLLALIPLG